MRFGIRGRWMERFCFAVGALAALALVHEFARFGLTEPAFILGAAAAGAFAFAGFFRHQRIVTEFMDRHPAWPEHEFRPRRWFGKR